MEDLRAVWSPSDKISHSAVNFTPDEQKPTTPEFDLLKRNRGQADRTSGDLMTPSPSHCQIDLENPKIFGSLFLDDPKCLSEKDMVGWVI